MDNQEEEKRLQGRPTKPDEELAWRRKSTPPASHILADKSKKIPKRFQAILCLMQDDRNATGRVLTREQLDELPQTKAMPKQEKDLLYSYWPRWQAEVAQLNAIAVLRKDQTDAASKPYKVADQIARREEFDLLSLPQQMRVTGAVLEKQMQNAAIIAACASVEDVTTDPNAQLNDVLHKRRIAYVKDASWLRNTLFDLAERIEQRANDEQLSDEDSEELNSILVSANELVTRRASR